VEAYYTLKWFRKSSSKLEKLWRKITRFRHWKLGLFLKN